MKWKTPVFQHFFSNTINHSILLMNVYECNITMRTHSCFLTIYLYLSQLLTFSSWMVQQGKKKHGNMSQNHSNTKGLGLDALSNPTSIISWWSKHPYLHPWTNHQNIQTHMDGTLDADVEWLLLWKKTSYNDILQVSYYLPSGNLT